jgi:hypothetical protein
LYVDATTARARARTERERHAGADARGGEKQQQQRHLERAQRARRRGGGAAAVHASRHRGRRFCLRVFLLRVSARAARVRSQPRAISRTGCPRQRRQQRLARAHVDDGAVPPAGAGGGTLAPASARSPSSMSMRRRRRRQPHLRGATQRVRPYPRKTKKQTRSGGRSKRWAMHLCALLSEAHAHSTTRRLARCSAAAPRVRSHMVGGAA